MKDSNKANEISRKIDELIVELKQERERMKLKYCNDCYCNICRNQNRHCESCRECDEGSNQVKQTAKCDSFVYGG